MLSNTSSTDHQLRRWAQELKVPLNGIVYKDELDQIRPHLGSYIINMSNTDDRETPHGSHWVGLYLGRHTATYMDSFGVVPPLAVIAFAKRYGVKDLELSNKQIQNLNGGFCGSYVLLFLSSMVHGGKHGFAHFVEKFDAA